MVLIAVRLLCLLTLMGLVAVLPAYSQNKMALVIGNSEYTQLPPLVNPANDAKLLSENLQQLGFTVTALTDQSQAEMKSAIARFTQGVTMAGPDTIALLYYAGHGVQIDGTNYLMPVDANAQTAGDVVLGAVSASDLLKTLELAKAKVNVLVLDACRDNPFKSNTRGVSRGLARVEAPAGSIVAYATAPGQVAADGDGDNSPYAQALAKNLATPGLALELVFRQVRIEVSEKTAGAQVPWEETSLTQEIVLKSAAHTQQPDQGPVATATPEVEAARAYMVAVGSNKIEDYLSFLQKHPVAKEAPQALRNIEMLADEKNWREATHQNTLGAYKIYLNLHPQGTYAAEAQNQIAGLSSKVVTPSVQESVVVTTPQLPLSQMTERRGYDVSGTDIQTLKNVDFQLCSSACENMPECAAAAYRADLQRCYLKSTATLIMKNNKVDMIIRASQSDLTRVSMFEVMPQVDIPGNDLFPTSTKIDTAQNCLRLCEKTNKCNAFSYVTSNKACWLKSGAASFTRNPPVVSGVTR